ncbi:MAG: DUF4339 domain-containing protein [Chthoniobacteraceae bacterium]|jgi:hypothetical protein
MKKKYEEPDSVRLLRVLAGVGAIAGVICLAVSAQAHNPGEAEWEVCVGVGGLASALSCFLFAVLLNAVCRTAFHTERAADALEKMETIPQPSSPLLPTALGAAVASGPETLKPAARRFFVEKPGGEQLGPLDVGQLQKLLDAGAIFAETPVFREGDEEWKTLGTFISK